MKNTDSQLKDARLGVRCTKEQKEQLAINARNNNMPISEFVLDRTLKTENEKIRELKRTVKMYQKREEETKRIIVSMTEASNQFKAGVNAMEAGNIMVEGVGELLCQYLK